MDLLKELIRIARGLGNIDI